jgi:hypothetical protein
MERGEGVVVKNTRQEKARQGRRRKERQNKTRQDKISHHKTLQQKHYKTAQDLVWGGLSTATKHKQQILIFQSKFVHKASVRTSKTETEKGRQEETKRVKIEER